MYSKIYLVLNVLRHLFFAVRLFPLKLENCQQCGISKESVIKEVSDDMCIVITLDGMFIIQ